MRLPLYGLVVLLAAPVLIRAQDSNRPESRQQAEEKEVNKCIDEVQEMTTERWCEHTLNALSALRLNRNMSPEKLQAIVASAERLKGEMEDFGVTTRHLFITLGRSVQV